MFIVLFAMGCARHSSTVQANNNSTSTNSAQRQADYKATEQRILNECTNIKTNPAFSSLAGKIPLTSQEIQNRPLKMLALKTVPSSASELYAIEQYAGFKSQCAKRWERFYNRAKWPQLGRIMVAAENARQKLLLDLYEKKISFGAYNQAMVVVDEEADKAWAAAVERARAQRRANGLRALQMGWALSGANPANQRYRGRTETTCRRYGNEVRCESY